MPASDDGEAKDFTSSRFKNSTVRSKRMAANAKQGTYLGTTLTGFTSFVAGLYTGGGIGIVVAIVGAALLVVSAAGFHKIKTA